MNPILRRQDGKNEIWLSGYVIQNEDKWFYDWLGYDTVCPADIIDALGQLNSEPVTVRIDGYGGSVFAGATIFQQFMDYPGNVDFIITGLSASILSVIPMASVKKGNNCKMSPLAMMMLHNVQGGRDGDYRDMEHEAERLKAANATIRSAYRMKSGLSDEKIGELMDNETWLDAQGALDLGLIDEILYTDDFTEDTQPPRAMINALQGRYRAIHNSIIPPSRNSIEQIRAALHPPNAPPEDDPEESHGDNDDINQAKALFALEEQRYGGIHNA